jgi:hypothetical protein
MPKNKIDDLRNHLFETMEKLLDADDPMDIQRAEAVAKVAQVVVNTAKVEVDFLRHTGHGGSGFIGNGQQLPPGGVPLKAVKSLDGLGPASYADLCTRCELPECDEASPRCLIQIERHKEAA